MYLLFVVLTLALLAFISYGTYSTAKLLQSWTPNRNLLLIPAENVVRLGMILLCIGLGWLSALPRADLGWTADRALWQIIIGGLLGFGLAAFFYLSTRVIARKGNSRFYSTVIIEAILPRNGRQLLLIGLVMVSVALLEELLFRSLLLGGLAPVVPTPLLLVGSSLLFGFLHTPQGIWGVIGSGAAGLLFGLLFLWTGSLLMPLTAHYVANMVQLAYAMRLHQRGELFQ